MKTLTTIVALFAFSAIFFSPSDMSEYPSKDFIDKKKQIEKKELEINQMITKIETVVKQKKRKNKNAN
jgi:hypothetical protein